MAPNLGNRRSGECKLSSHLYVGIDLLLHGDTKLLRRASVGIHTSIYTVLVPDHALLALIFWSNLMMWGILLVISVTLHLVSSQNVLNDVPNCAVSAFHIVMVMDTIASWHRRIAFTDVEVIQDCDH